jgi:hypothetical protein
VHKPVDVVAALSAQPSDAAWMVPAAGQLTLGGGALTPRDDKDMFEVDVLEERGSDVRVGIRLSGIRFALWTARESLMPALVSTEELRELPGVDRPATGDVKIVLREGARVIRLARERSWTKVRYVGSLEAEGWVPTTSLAERGPAGRVTTRKYSSSRSTYATPGYAIRSEADRNGRLLATVSYSTSIQIVKQLDTRWAEVTFEDTDILVHGFGSKQEPPVPTHPRRKVTFARPIGPHRVPDKTCLYAGDEAIGVVVGDAWGTLSAGMRTGWFTFTVDTAWDSIAFDVRGPLETQLETCTSSLP